VVSAYLLRDMHSGEAYCLLHSLKGGCGEVGAGLFSQVTSNNISGNGLKFHQGRFRLDI